MNKQRYKLAIFDCDGVLFDSREANRHYYNDVLRSLGLPEMTEEQLDYCHSHTATESLYYLLSNYPDEYIKKANKIISKLKYDDYLNYMQEEPGMRETVQELKKMIKTAISTNRSTTMPLLVSMYKLDTIFDKIVCALDVINPKPHPEGVFKILDFFKIKPKESVYIGDTYVDEKVASAAGVPFIAYKDDKLNAMFHVEHFAELKKILIG